MVAVGDLVYIVPTVSDHLLPEQLMRMTRGIIFSQIDEHWFRVYATNKEQTRVLDFPRWMLQKVIED
jgi:hypothetical protein